MWGKKRVRYVQVYDGDSRPYAVKHQSADYLRQLSTMASNSVFVTETQYALERMRAVKDRAETPEETKGINACLEIMKSLVMSPYKAADMLAYIQAQEE